MSLDAPASSAVDQFEDSQETEEEGEVEVVDAAPVVKADVDKDTLPNASVVGGGDAPGVEPSKEIDYNEGNKVSTSSNLEDRGGNSEEASALGDSNNNLQADGVLIDRTADDAGVGDGSNAKPSSALSKNDVVGTTNEAGDLIVKTKETQGDDKGSSSSNSKKRSLDDVGCMDVTTTTGDDTGNRNKSTHTDEDSTQSKQQQQNTSASSRWDEMFGRLLEYKEQFGDCLVPNRYSADPPLGHWVSSQRRQYKTIQIGQPGTSAMTEQRIKKLQDIGFDWETTDPRHVPWQVRYEELKEYVRKYGDAEVPMRWKENIQLSNWVSKQRHDYKLRQRGASGRLTDARYKLLNDVGFVWDAGKPDIQEHEAPSPLQRPSKRTSRGARSSRQSSSGRRNSSSSRRSSASDNDLPQDLGAEGTHNAGNLPHPVAHGLQNAIAADVLANPAQLLEAANTNSMKLQLAGLYAGGEVGSGGRVAPGGLLTLPIPASNGVIFVPIIQNFGNSDMPQAGNAGSFNQMQGQRQDHNSQNMNVPRPASFNQMHGQSHNRNNHNMPHPRNNASFNQMHVQSENYNNHSMAQQGMAASFNQMHGQSHSRNNHNMSHIRNNTSFNQMHGHPRNPNMPQPQPGNAASFNPMQAFSQGGPFPPGAQMHPMNPMNAMMQQHHGGHGAQAFHHGHAGGAMARRSEFLNVVQAQNRQREDPPEG